MLDVLSTTARRRRLTTTVTATLALFLLAALLPLRAHAGEGSGGTWPPPRPDYDTPFAVERINEAPGGASADDDTRYAALSGNGLVAAFSTAASNLGPAGDAASVFVQTATGVREPLMVQRTLPGHEGGEPTTVLEPAFGQDLALDGDGSTVAISTHATVGEDHVPAIEVVEVETGAARTYPAPDATQLAAPVLSADGNTVAYLANESADGLAWKLYVARTAETVPTVVADLGAAMEPAFDLSPDGSRLAYYRWDVGAGWTAWTIDLTDPEPTPAQLGIIDAGGTFDRLYGGPAFSGDGQVLAVVAEEDYAQRIVLHAPGTTATALPVFGNGHDDARLYGGVTSVAVDDDGSTVAFTLTEATEARVLSQAWVYDVDVDLLSLASSTATGADSTGIAEYVHIGSDGNRVLFPSDASDLVEGDDGEHLDVFVAERSAAARSEAPTWPAGAELAVAAVREAAVDLTWPVAEDDEGVVAYQVLVDGLVTQEIEVTDPAGPFGTTVEGLRGDTAYQVGVRALDADRQRTPVLEIEARTAPPSAAWMDVVAEPYQVRLAWSLPGPAVTGTGYRVVRTGGGGEHTADLVGLETTEYLDTTVSPDTAYEYVVQRLDGDEVTPYAGPEAVTTPAPDATLDATAPSRGEVVLTWAPDPAGADAYRVLRATGAGELDLVATVDADARTEDYTFTDDTVSLGQHYTYRVDSVRGGDDRRYTTLATVQSRSAADLWHGMADGAVQLYWAQDASAAGYRVERAAADGDFELIETLPADADEYLDVGVPADTALRYRVLAVLGDGRGVPHTAELDVTTPPLTTPSGSLDVQTSYWDVLQRGTDVVIEATGQQGRDADATVTYRSWYASDDASVLLDEPAERTATVSLEPTGAGTYRGAFPLVDGVARLDSVTVTLADDAGHDATSDELLATPMPVSGGFQLVPMEGADQLAQISATSVGIWRSYWEPFDAGAVELDGLAPDRRWNLAVYHRDGNEVGSTAVDVVAGLVQPLEFDPVLPATPVVTVAWGGAAPAGWRHVQLLDATDRYVGQANVGDDGVAAFTTWFTEGQTVVPVLRVQDPYRWQTIEADDFVIYPNEIRGEPIELVPGENHIALDAEPLARGVITGTIREGETPLADVVVTATQQVGDRSLSYRAVTGPDGAFRMPVVAGTLDVTASIPGDAAPVTLGDDIVVAAGATEVLDRTLEPPREYTVVPTVHSDPAGPAGATVVSIEEWRVRAHWPVWLQRGGHRAHFPGSPWKVMVRPGTLGRVCTSGHEAGLDQVCEPVTFADQADPIAVTLTVPGRATLTAQFVQDDAPYTGWLSAELHRVADDGTTELVERLTIRSGELQDARVGVGEYELRVTTADLRGGTTFTVGPDDAEKALGEIPLSPAPSRVFTDDSGVAVVSSVVPSGGIIDVRATARSRGLAYSDAAVVLTAPSGAELRAVQVDGVAIEAHELPAMGDDGTYRIAIGDIGREASRVVRAQFVTAPATIGRFVLGADVHAGDAVLPLGSATVEVGTLTLEAPATATSTQVWLSGRGPVGAELQVYVDGRSAGIVPKIERGGRWRLQVTLAGDERRVVQVHAVARLGELEVRTPDRPMTVDPTRPKITKVEVNQEDGRLVEFFPADGVARFPYVFVPSQETFVRLFFDRPDRVENVRVRVVDTEVLAERQEDGTYLAVLETSKFGRISTRYDVLSPMLNGLDDVPALSDNPDQVQRLIPPIFAGATEIEASVPGQRAWSVPGLGEGVQISLDMQIDRSAPYAPTEDDLADQRRSGVGAGASTFDVSEGPDGTLSIVVTTPIAEAFLPPAGTDPGAPPEGDVSPPGEVAGLEAALVQAFNGSALAAADSGGGRARVKIDIKGLQDKADSAQEVYDKVKDMADGFSNLQQKIDRLQSIRSRIPNCPGYSSPLWEDIAGDLDSIERSLRSAQVTDGVVRGLFNVVKLGPGEQFYSKVGDVMSQAWDAQFDRLLNRADFWLDMGDCPPPPPPGSGGSGSSGGSGGGGDDDGGDGGGDTLADPTPIYDPSGYVYEGMHSNRIEGVTATVMQAEDEEGPWTVWDAEWFGQINPQLTDPNGRYGWDVPEDWWQVVFTKDGYHQAMSDELLVLPPHFDVNIGITSVLPAAVSDASGTAGETGEPGELLLEFDRPVQVASVLDERADNVTVRRGEDEVAGTWAAVGAEDDPSRDGELAMTFRFVPDEALVAGESLTVATDVGVRDYADRPLKARDDRPVTVAAVPVDPGPGEGPGGGGTPGGGGSPGGGGGAPVPGRGGVPVPAPTGDGPVAITVDTPAGPARIELQGVRDAGTVQVVAGDGASRRGFRLLDTWFELDTDVAFTSATVCLPYDEDEVAASGIDESALSLLHGMDDGTIEDVTSYRETGRVCGVVTSFSPFWLGAPATERLAGSDRYATAAAISRATFDAGVEVAYVVTGSTFADGLVGGPAAARLGAPVLLTGGNELPAATRDELLRLRPGRIEVLGGPAAVSETVTRQLQSLTRGGVTRIAGADRYSTAAELAMRAFSDVDTVYVATGRTFADALVGGAAAIADGAPLLLLPDGALPAGVREALAQLAPETIVIVGGTGAVSEATARQLAATGADVTRLAGADRYETAARVAAEAGEDRPVVAASGETFADALAGLPLAAADGAALVLVRAGAVPASVHEVLEQIRPPRLTVLGGTAAVSRPAELTLATTMAG